MVRIVKLPEQRRREIVEAAGQVFLQKGYESTTMQDVMQRLGIAKGTIYHYFSSKNDMLGAVLMHQSWSDSPPELAAAPEDRVIDVCEALIQHLARHPWIIELQVTSETVDPFTAWAADVVLDATETLGLDAEHRITFASAMWRLVLAEATIRSGSEAQIKRTGRSEADILVDRFRELDDLPHLQRAALEAPGIIEHFSIERVIRALLRCTLDA